MRLVLRLSLAGVLGGILPEAVEACAWCLSSASGDQSFGWPYLALIVAPFLVGITIGGVLAWHAGLRPGALARRLALWSKLPPPAQASRTSPVPVTKETT